VAANGSVILYGRETARGRLSNISSGGMLVRLLHSESVTCSGEHVEIGLHLDRAGARWLQFGGEVVRHDEGEVAVSFTSVPIDFADVVQDALVSALEGAAVPHVLLVDSDAERRAPFAALLRRAGYRVAEAATPLDAIAYLGGSAIHSWVVAISSTVPENIADELQRFLADTESQIDVRMLGSTLPTNALMWLAATARSPS
jgi:CheY-like chemotaxis protein